MVSLRIFLIELITSVAYSNFCRITFSINISSLEKMIASKQNEKYQNIKLIIQKILALRTKYPQDKSGNIDLYFTSTQKLFDQLKLPAKMTGSDSLRH